MNSVFDLDTAPADMSSDHGNENKMESLKNFCSGNSDCELMTCDAGPCKKQRVTTHLPEMSDNQSDVPLMLQNSCIDGCCFKDSTNSGSSEGNPHSLDGCNKELNNSEEICFHGSLPVAVSCGECLCLHMKTGINVNKCVEKSNNENLIPNCSVSRVENDTDSFHSENAVNLTNISGTDPLFQKKNTRTHISDNVTDAFQREININKHVILEKVINTSCEKIDNKNLSNFSAIEQEQSCCREDDGNDVKISEIGTNQSDPALEDETNRENSCRISQTDICAVSGFPKHFDNLKATECNVVSVEQNSDVRIGNENFFISDAVDLESLANRNESTKDEKAESSSAQNAQQVASPYKNYDSDTSDLRQFGELLDKNTNCESTGSQHALASSSGANCTKVDVLPVPTTEIFSESTDKNSESTDKNSKSTEKNSESMDENYESTDKNYESTDKNYESTDENYESTDKNYESTDQNYESMDKNYESMDENYESTDKNSESTTLCVREYCVSSDDPDSTEFSKLPFGILVIIFRYLSLSDLLCKVCHVCRRWHDASQDPSLWRRVSLVGQKRLSNDILDRVTSFSDRVLYLDLTDCRGGSFTDAGFIDVLRKCRYLKHFKMARYFVFLDNTFAHLGTCCPALRHINLDVCFSCVTDKTVAAIGKGCPHLECLYLSQCNKISDEGIVMVARGCPKLKQLRVDQCVKIGDRSLQELADGCPEIDYLHLLSCNLTDIGIGHLSKLVNLCMLDISNIQQLSSRCVEAMVRSCKKFEVLSISLNRAVDDECIRVIVQECKVLKRFSCVACNLTDKALEYMATYSTSLEKVDVAWCGDITDLGVRVISDRLTSLQYLGLLRCGQITMETIDELVDRYPRIYYSNFVLESRKLVKQAEKEGLKIPPIKDLQC